jgi:hypothetical protein
MPSAATQSLEQYLTLQQIVARGVLGYSTLRARIASGELPGSPCWRQVARPRKATCWRCWNRSNRKQSDTMTYTINDEWGGGAQPPRDQPAPEPQFTISGKPVGPAAGWATPPAPPPAPDATPFALAQDTIAKTNAQFAAHRDGVAAQPGMLSEEGQRAALAAFDASAVDAAEQLAIQREADAVAEVDRMRAALVTPGDAAAEQRNTRYRDRLVREIESAKSPLRAAQDAVAHANLDQLGVIMEELPSLMAQKGLPTEGWLDRVVAAKVPEYGVAQQKAHNAAQARTVISYNACAVRNGIAAGHPAHALVDASKYDPDAQ